MTRRRDVPLVTRVWLDSSPGSILSWQPRHKQPHNTVLSSARVNLESLSCRHISFRAQVYKPHVFLWQRWPERKCPRLSLSPELRTRRVRDTILSFPLLQIKRWGEGADESEACIAGQQWLSPIAKPQRGSAQITHSADKKLVISIDKKHRGSDKISPGAGLLLV